jgi:hypothetical protein
MHSTPKLGRGCRPFVALALVLLLAGLPAPPARAGVGVILNDTLDESVARITGSGHTAVYFSHICADSPVKLRLCRPGEEGSVMSNYINIGEDKNPEWNIVPLSIYVNGVENPRNRPLIGTDKIKATLENRYRDEYLGPYCTTEACRSSDKSEWREMVGAGLSRNFYIFLVETTRRQDLEIISKYNAHPNVNHFNGAIRNCADFTKDAVNDYFPHSAHRDFLNDFGMTSPKAVARSFTHYALAHPEMQFRVLHFSQLPGTIKRSTEPHSGTEQLYHSKKLLIPMIVFADHELPVIAASYLLTGRFNPQRQFEEHSAASPASSALSTSIASADPPDDASSADSRQALEIEERDEIVGAPEEWKAYRRALGLMIDDAIRQEMFPDRGALKRLMKWLDEKGQPTLTFNGSIWMELPGPIVAGASSAAMRRVGLSTSNILARDSDPILAYEVLLVRADRELRSPMHSRETMIEFKEDWALLQAAQSRAQASFARLSNTSPAPSTPARGSSSASPEHN